MQSKNLNWYKVADKEDALDFSARNIAVSAVNGKKICIGRHQDKLFAFAYTCPHSGGSLSDGWIDVTGNVVCPVHCYKFSMANGRNVSGEGYYLKHWPVEKRAHGIFVGMEETGLLNWL